MAAKKAGSASAAATKPSAPTREKRLKVVAGFVNDASGAEGGRLLQDRIRLGIMSALSVNSSMSFSELKELLDASDGNLSKHARKLEDAGYIDCKKLFANRVPKTKFSLSAKGKKLFAQYLAHMESLIRATQAK